MTKLVQLVYISRATFSVAARNDGIAPEVSQILRKSRKNNRAKHIVGALYFGNHYFFQCLEGDETDLMALYETLKRDPQHDDLRILSQKTITERSFGTWEMKYLPAEKDVQKLLRSFGMSSFNPYQFDDAMITKMLHLLVQGPDLQLEESVSVPGMQPTLTGDCGKWKLGMLVLGVFLIMSLVWQFLH